MIQACQKRIAAFGTPLKKYPMKKSEIYYILFLNIQIIDLRR